VGFNDVNDTDITNFGALKEVGDQTVLGLVSALNGTALNWTVANGTTLDNTTTDAGQVPSEASSNGYRTGLITVFITTCSFLYLIFYN
jgi:hypothetical protein